VIRFAIIFSIISSKGVAMIFCWGGPDFKLQTNDRYILQMYLVFNVFYFYSGVGQKGSGVGPGPPGPPLCYALDFQHFQVVILCSFYLK
jgi:hypothetical protein